jgi:MFS family permease
VTGIAYTPAPPGHAVDARAARLLLITMCGCVVAVQGIVAAVNLAVPPLTQSPLRPSPAQVLWFVDSYIVAFACLLIPAGAAAGRYGHRRVLVTGLGVYLLGCAASAVAVSSAMLIAARTATGCGAALVLPTTLAILMRALPVPLRPKAVATWTASTFLGGAAGNVVAGIAIHYGSWRVLFAVLGVGAGVLLPAVRAVVPDTATRGGPLDVPGAALLTVSVPAAIYGIISGPELGWTSARVIGAFALAATGLVIFVLYERRASDPMIDLRLFAAPRLRAGSAGTLLLFVGMAALFLGNAQFLQYGKGFTPLQTGLASLPLAVGLFAASRLSVPVAARFGAAVSLCLGMGGVAAGLFGLSQVTADTPYAIYAVALTVIAAGTGLASPTLSTGIMISATSEQQGTAAGLNSLVREIGSALGVALFGTIAISGFGARLGDTAPHDHRGLLAVLVDSPVGSATSQAYVHSMGTAYLVLAAIVAVAGLLVVAGWLVPTGPDHDTVSGGK